MQIRFGETSLDFSYRRESEQMIASAARLMETRVFLSFCALLRANRGI